MSNIINIGGTSGGSGSSIVPNPQGTATDTLTKLGIEGTIYDFASGGGSGSGHNYSTTEQVVGTWIDGSTVYEKTFDFSFASAETWSSSALGLNIDKVVYLFAYVKLGTQGGSQWITSPFIESSNYRCDCHYQSADDKFYVKSNWSATNAIITIRYTKSTT